MGIRINQPNNQPDKQMTPLERLRKHVTGKIESGQAIAIVEIPAEHVTPDQTEHVTRNQAIKLARQNVSQLTPLGNGYRYSRYIFSLNAWQESTPREYFSAQFNRSQALIDIARDAMGLTPRQYDGGAWTTYL